MGKLTIRSIKYFQQLNILFALFFLPGNVSSQNNPLTIQEAYALAEKNYPLTKQYDLIEKSTAYTVVNAARGFLPSFSVNGQSTYQSEVTNLPFQVPIQGFKIPTISKDQYKGYVEADQLVYDGGLTRNQQQAARLADSLQKQNVKVQLYSLFERVNQVYFGVLLLDEQLKLNAILQQDLRNGVDRQKALLANGVAYRSSVDEISAQLLQNDQAAIELNTMRKAYLDMLSLLIHTAIDENTVFVKPASPQLNADIIRPELQQFDFRKAQYDVQSDLIHTSLRPKIRLFAQGGYGRPGLNFLSNNFEWYYIGGLRFNWNLGSLYTLKNQQAILDLNKKSVDAEKEAFIFNARLTMTRQDASIAKYAALLQKDDSILVLRESVKKAADAQLENGVITARDYVNVVLDADKARQNKILHEMELLQDEYSYLNTTGQIATDVLNR